MGCASSTKRTEVRIIELEEQPKEAKAPLEARVAKLEEEKKAAEETAAQQRKAISALEARLEHQTEALKATSAPPAPPILEPTEPESATCELPGAAAAEADESRMMVTPTGKQITTHGEEVGPDRWAITSTQVESLLHDHIDLFTDPNLNARVFVQEHVRKSHSKGRGIALTHNDDDPKKVELMVSHTWDEPMGKFLRDILIVTSDKEHLGMFVCFLALYQGSQEELTAQVTQGKRDLKDGCFAEVLASVKKAGGFMMVVSNDKVRDNGLYSRLWCTWEVYCAVQDEVPIVVHPLTGSEAHLFGTGGKQQFQPELGRCGNPKLEVTMDEIHIRDAIENSTGWDPIRKALLKVSQFTTVVGRVDVADVVKIGPKGIKLLLDAVATDNIPCDLLDLYGNSIGDSGVEALATILQHNNTIKVLRLPYNNIGDLGAQVLATMLQHNNTIDTLYLYDNNIGDSGTQALNHVEAAKRAKGMNFSVHYV